jgi:antitoxin (DNA-binding transcriptional repressor) of toxin-antitoxin stability system
MPTVTIQEAQARLPELIRNLLLGEELVITENDLPVANLRRTEPQAQLPRKAGSAKGTPHWMAPDFDAPLEEFKDYME